MEHEELIDKLIKLAAREQSGRETHVRSASVEIDECSVIKFVLPHCPPGELRLLLEWYRNAYCKR